MPSLMLGTLELLGAPYSAQVGTSMGSWASITTATSSLFLDGSVVSGEATGNREITLQVMVDSTTRPLLIAACEALIGEANKASNTITFTPDVGPAVVYEVFRADRPERSDDEAEAFTRRTYSLSFPALPFARSATRATPSAMVSTVVMDSLESAYTGLVAQAMFADGDAFRWWAPMDSVGSTLLVFLTGATLNNSLTVVTNATLTYPGGTQAIVTTTADGLVEFRSAAAWAVAGDVVTVAANIKRISGTGARQYLAGVEWLDSGGAAIRTDWGIQTGVTNDVNAASFSVWAASRVPAGAVTVRLRLQVIGALTGQTYEVTDVAAHSSVLATVTPVASAMHDGTNGLSVGNVNTSTKNWPWQSSYYTYRALPAAVDISAQYVLYVWVQTANAGMNNSATLSSTGAVSLRLWDATGKWSRYAFTGQVTTAATWKQLAATLATPYMSSDAGPVNLAAVTAYDIDIIGNGVTVSTWVHVDTLVAGPTSTVALSPRGTVYALDPIVGSARTTAAVTVSSATALTDWLVAAIDGTTGPPLLVVGSNVATAAAPAGHDGVYSILGCIAPATVLAAPTCTVVQKNAGVTVATRVLTGTTRVGNRYVDFGAVELPLVATPPENLGVSYTFTLAPSSASWVEVLVIDVDASLAWVDNMTTALPVGWIDEPDIIAGLGKVWVGTATDKTDARALALPLTMSRPLQVKAPSTRLLVYSTTIAPSISLSYFPRWLVEPS